MSQHNVQSIMGEAMRAEEVSNLQASVVEGSVLETYHPAVAAPFLRVVRDPPSLPSFEVLGVRVNAVQMSEAVERIRFWLDAPDRNTHFVAVTAMHSVAEARHNEAYRRILNSADLSVPDGMPLIWLARFNGFALKNRVCGSELMETFCRVTGSTYRHFFYGGGPGVAEKLAQSLHEKCGIAVAGTYTPPFRALTAAEEQEIASRVEQSSPDVLWVGLSSPKQERWIDEHRPHLKIPVMLGVGAAFDMNSGITRRAPGWMRESGMEWLHRLCSEPRRLWKRYLFTIPAAMGFVGLELLGASISSSTRSKGGSVPANRERE
jgi:N-acetylglucosaminyldiphosphoundecaprenol N-acetyl-beta-D-mannosaminyltransferase